MARRHGGKRTDVLHDALRLPPWVFPFDGSDDVPIFALNAQSETTGELWRALRAEVLKSRRKGRGLKVQLRTGIEFG